MTTIKKIQSYEVNADGKRCFSARKKTDVMDVFRAWKRQGHNPQAYKIGYDADGKIVCDKIAE